MRCLRLFVWPLLGAALAGHVSAASDGVSSTPAMVNAMANDRYLLALKETYFIATLVESYAVDHGPYPILDRAPAAVTRLKPQLASYAQGALPGRDPWHSPYLYWSDGKDYAIISLGADSRPEMDYAALLSRGYPAFCRAALDGRHDARGSDLIFADGMIGRWSGVKVIAPFK
jgi:hypothetical protein